MQMGDMNSDYGILWKWHRMGWVFNIREYFEGKKIRRNKTSRRGNNTDSKFLGGRKGVLLL